MEPDATELQCTMIKFIYLLLDKINSYRYIIQLGDLHVRVR